MVEKQRISSAPGLVSVINISSVPDALNNDHLSGGVNRANRPVIANAVSPQATFNASQGFSATSRVVQWRDALPEIFKYFSLNGLVQF